MQRISDSNQTIFAQFDRASPLAPALELAAAQRGMQIYWGQDGSPDLIAVNALLMVIDRAHVGVENYNAFVAYTIEVNSDAFEIPDADLKAELTAARSMSTCVIIDALVDLPFPKLPVVIQLDVDSANVGHCLDPLISLALAAYSG